MKLEWYEKSIYIWSSDGQIQNQFNAKLQISVVIYYYAKAAHSYTEIDVNSAVSSTVIYLKLVSRGGAI